MHTRLITYYLLVSALAVGTARGIVSAGTAAKTAIIRVTGDRSFDKRFNPPLTESNLNAAIADLIQPYLDSGYYYCGGTITSIEESGDSTIVHLRLNRGPIVTIRDITFVGLTRTHPATVKRYLGLEKNMPLTDRAIAQIAARAKSIPFLTSDSTPVAAPLPGYTQADLQLTFHEPRQLVVQGTAGYRADDHNGLIWSFDATARNLFGDGRRARLTTERTDVDHNSLGIQYSQPVFLFGVSEWTVNLSTRNFRKQFYEFNSTVRYAIRTGDQTSVGLELGWKRVDPATSEPSYKRYTAGLNYRSSTFVDSINPSRGAELDWSLAYVDRRYQADSSAVTRTSQRETRVRLDAQVCRRLLDNLVGSMSGRFSTLETKESLPPISELFLIGGYGTIRGYRNEQFAVRRFAGGTAELRWRGRSGYLFAFGDLGYLNFPESTQDNSVVTRELYKVGYGIGLNLIDRDRAVTLAFAWNPELRLGRPQVLLRLISGL